ncbi:hypothetical protein [Bacteroides acidifaciens]|uniref:hypothetical protein n=1 Tax=Bacteroides acidifaciens TaxID=85831 RepID=UPI0025A9A3B9|nr:hypothetical protein [Bacteroides acidifaciens]
MLILIIAIVAVIGIVWLQFKCFNSTKKGIEELKTFFPPIDKVALKECTTNKDAISDRFTLRQVAQNPPSKKDEVDMTDEDVNVSLITTTGGSKSFKEVVFETNEYLCKNVGTSADLGVLQDICDKKLEVKENAVKSTLNLPLFVGLGGTFIGIIIGVIGFAFDLNSLFDSTSSLEIEQTISAPVGNDNVPTISTVESQSKEASSDETNSLQFLLYGIGCAMAASLCGLVLMVINTAINYRKATADLDTKRNEYFDFLRRELMPTLANSMSSSLNSLKSVLGHFVDKFGKNLDAYADSAELLNENLEKQHLVLTQIQDMGMTRMANRVASAFVQLNEAADALNTFHQYQQDLNTTIHQVQGGVAQIDTLIAKFDNFISALSSVANAQGTAIALQQQFKEAIEQHFPTGADGREMWRKEFDNLLTDAQTVSRQLNSQLTQNTSYVQQFVTDNNKFFTSFDEMRSVLAALVEYSKAQSECYKDLKDEILSLRKDTKDSQRETAELHKSLLEAVKAMTKAVKDLKD